MEVTVAEVCVMYLEFANTRYRLPDGKLSSSYDGMVQAVSALQKHRQLPATAFGPRCLRQVVEQLTQQKSRNGKPRPRRTINRPKNATLRSWKRPWAGGSKPFMSQVPS